MIDIFGFIIYPLWDPVNWGEFVFTEEGQKVTLTQKFLAANPLGEIFPS